MSQPRQERHSRRSDPYRRSALLERARRWSDARVTFDRVTDVGGRCPHCDALVTRRLGPGVLCGICGRLWVVREMLERETQPMLGAA